MNLETLVGPVAVIAAVVLVPLVLVPGIAREWRGPAARESSLVEARPWQTAVTVLVVGAGVALFVLRLGVLS